MSCSDLTQIESGPIDAQIEELYECDRCFLMKGCDHRPAAGVKRARDGRHYHVTDDATQLGAITTDFVGKTIFEIFPKELAEKLAVADEILLLERKAQEFFVTWVTDGVPSLWKMKKVLGTYRGEEVIITTCCNVTKAMRRMGFLDRACEIIKQFVGDASPGIVNVLIAVMTLILDYYNIVDLGIV